jgi:hypothetical protein
MTQILTFNLPPGSSADDGKALESAMRSIDVVKSAGVQQVRGDLATIAVWLSIAKPAADIAMDVVRKMVDVIRGKGLSGVVIELPNNGGTVRVDSASAADLEKLMKAIRATPVG